MIDLQVSGLGLAFAGLRALNGISFEVGQGEIFGLIGPNGAGKTTLLNCLSGVYRPDSGTVRFQSRDILALPVHALAGLGISRTFQNLELFGTLTLRENVLIGTHPHHPSGLLAQLVEWPSARCVAREAAHEADAIIRDLGLAEYADCVVSQLAFGIQKMAELARALAGRPRLLLLDEPAAGLNPEESRQLGARIRALRDRLNLTVILVEHDMPLVMNLCDRILAIDHGQLICTGTPAEVRGNPAVIEAYLGQDDPDA